MVRRPHQKGLWLKVGGGVLIVVAIGLMTFLFARDIKVYDYIVETNAFFAPFEFYDNREIVGVDIEIIDRVAKKLDATIDVKNVEFDMIIDNVASGVIADAGAAGLTITPARAEKVNFTIPYYTSVQYVVFAPERAPEIRDKHVTWDAMAGKILGSQMGGTGYLFAADEAQDGILAGTNTTVKGLDSHQLAADAIKAHIIDYAIADQLAAQFIVAKNPELVALPLYYRGDIIEEDYPVKESYAIAVNKERTELLAAFNEVLEELMVVGPDGRSELDQLIIKYMGLNEEINNERHA